MKRYLFHPVTALVVVVLVVTAFLNSPILRQRVTGYLDTLAAKLPEVTPPPPKPKPVIPPMAVSVVDPVEATGSSTDGTLDLPEVDQSQSQDGQDLPAPMGAPDSFFTASAAESNRAALTTILSVWKKSPEGDIPDSLDPTDLETFAQNNALSIEFLQPAIDQLLALDLPAVVQLQKNDTVRAVALTAANDDGITLRSGEDSWTMNRSAFRKQYTGDAIVLWEDPTPNTAALLPGSQNANVRQLRTQLAAMGRIANGGDSDRYDGDLSKAVARIQAETSLDVDGIAGKQVRMVIQSWLKPDGTPGLGTPRKQVPLRQETPAPADPAPLEVVAAPTPTNVAPVVDAADRPAPSETTTTPEATVPETPSPAIDPPPATAASDEVAVEAPSLDSADTPEITMTDPPQEAVDTPAPVTLTNVDSEKEGAPAETTPETMVTTDETTSTPIPSEDPAVPTPTSPPEATPAPEAPAETEDPAPALGGQLTVVELPDPGTVLPAPPPEEAAPAE